MASTAKKTAASPKSDDPTPTLENMPARPSREKKTEHLFFAWTGQILKGGSDGPPAVRIDDLRPFGRKDLCTEFAVDQEPAWKWVQCDKGDSVAAAIIAKAESR